MNDANSTPREYTLDETRDLLIENIRYAVNYWDKDTRAGSTQERLEGLEWSILAILDGTTLGGPRFLVSPDPYPEDKEFHQSEGENWFPEGGDLGPLRYYLVKKKEKNNE